MDAPQILSAVRREFTTRGEERERRKGTGTRLSPFLRWYVSLPNGSLCGLTGLLVLRVPRLSYSEFRSRSRRASVWTAGEPELL